jgi:hypothetical protein
MEGGEGTHNLAPHFDMSHCSILIDVTSTGSRTARHIDLCSYEAWLLQMW